MNRELIGSPGTSGLTLAITRLQQHLHSALPWLEKSFGLAVDGYAVNAEKLTLTVPEVYIGNGEYDVVLPDDRYVSQVFYYADAAEQVMDDSPFLGYRMESNISIVVWLNLDKVKAEMGYSYTHRFIDELKLTVLDALNEFPDFRAARVENNVQRVWQNWTIGRGVLYYGDKKEYALTQIGKHPEAGFRIYGELVYEENCEVVTPEPEPTTGDTYFESNYIDTGYTL